MKIYGYLLISLLFSIQDVHGASSEDESSSDGDMVIVAVDIKDIKAVDDISEVQSAVQSATVPVIYPSLQAFKPPLRPVRYQHAAILDLGPNKKPFSHLFIKQAMKEGPYGAVNVHYKPKEKAVECVFDMPLWKFNNQKKNLLVALQTLGVRRVTFYQRNRELKRYSSVDLKLFDDMKGAQDLAPRLFFIDEAYWLKKRKKRRGL